MPKQKAMTKINPPSTAALVVPNYMAQAPQGTDGLKAYVVPPRLKIVQKQADPALLELFSEGDVILIPSMTLVSEMGRDDRGKPTGTAQPLRIIPVFFYPEWCTWNPIQMKGQGPAIRERTQDPSSVIAQKARSRDLRYEPHPEKPDMNIRHVEHLNFLCMMFNDSRATGEPFVVSFSRGEHNSGRRWAGLIRMRRAPIYGCVFEMHVSFRQNNLGSWWGFDVANPPADVLPWVGEDLFEKLKETHLEFAKMHAQGIIRVDHEDHEDEAPVVDQTEGDEL